MPKDYSCVSLHKCLADKIEQEILNSGFTSKAEFIRYCVFKEFERRAELLKK